MYKILCIASFLLWTNLIQGQNFNPQDFKEVDSYARSIKRGGRNSEQLAKKLAEPFEKESEKARAIFIWITENIAYDCKRYHEVMKKRSVKIEGKSEGQIDGKINSMRLQRIRKALAASKGVCQEYSELFQEMCMHVGIQAEFITGFTKKNAHKIGVNTKKSDHAWNAVQLDGKWYLLDATWAAGGTDEKITKFFKHYSEAYYLTDPATFLLSHFPDDPKWLLLDTTLTRDSFQLFPMAHLGLYEAELNDYYPKEGIIPYEEGGTVRFEVRFKDITRIDKVELIEGKDKVVAVLLPNAENVFSLDFDISNKNQKVMSLAVTYLHKESYKKTSLLLSYKIKKI